MPSEKRKSGTRGAGSAPASTKKPRVAAKGARKRAASKPLAVTERILREPVQGTPMLNPMTVLEPLRRQMVDRQIAWFGIVMAFSPAHVIADQQAAFWKGVVGEAPTGDPPRRKRTDTKKPKRTDHH